LNPTGSTKILFMTDRVKGLVITLEKDIRVDDVEAIIQSIRMIRGIAHVEPSITTAEDHMNRERIKYELRGKFYKFVQEELN